MKRTLLSLLKKLRIIKIWRIRNLTVQGKTTTFKTLTISKVIHLALVTNVLEVVIDQLNKI